MFHVVMGLCAIFYFSVMPPPIQFVRPGRGGSSIFRSDMLCSGRLGRGAASGLRRRDFAKSKAPSDECLRPDGTQQLPRGSARVPRVFRVGRLTGAPARPCFLPPPTNLQDHLHWEGFRRQGDQGV